MPETVRHQQLVTQKMAAGKEGRPIELLANFYKITTRGDVAVIHYDLDIVRNRPPKGAGAPGSSGGGGGGDSPPDVSGLNISGGGKSSSDSPSTDTSGEVNVGEPTTGAGGGAAPGGDAAGAGGAAPSTSSDRFVMRFASQVISKMIADNETFAGVRLVHDGQKNLYTTRMLDFKGQPSVKFAVQIDIDGHPADFNVRVRMVENVPVKEVIEYYTKKKADLSERVISIYEHVLRFIMGKDYAAFQRKLFDMGTISSSPKVTTTKALFFIF